MMLGVLGVFWVHRNVSIINVPTVSSPLGVFPDTPSWPRRLAHCAEMGVFIVMMLDVSGVFSGM